MKILVTGGAGFVGGAICNRLHEMGHTVDVLDNLQFSKKEDLPNRHNFFNMSLGCFVENLNVEYDFIIHAATVNIIYAEMRQVEAITTNYTDTVRLFEKYIDTPIIYLSTASVYGNNPDTIKEDSPISCSSVYAMTKYLAEKWLWASHPNFSIYRLSNVYGPRQQASNPYCGVIGKMIGCLVSNALFPVYGDGSDTRTYTYIDDVVDTICDLKITNNVINITSCVDLSVNDLLKIIPCNHFNIEPRAIDGISKRLVKTLYPSKIIYTPIDKGIAKTLAWVKKKP